MEEQNRELQKLWAKQRPGNSERTRIGLRRQGKRLRSRHQRVGITVQRSKVKKKTVGGDVKSLVLGEGVVSSQPTKMSEQSVAYGAKPYRTGSQTKKAGSGHLMGAAREGRPSAAIGMQMTRRTEVSPRTFHVRVVLIAHTYREMALTNKSPAPCSISSGNSLTQWKCQVTRPLSFRCRFVPRSMADACKSTEA